MQIVIVIVFDTTHSLRHWLFLCQNKLPNFDNNKNKNNMFSYSFLKNLNK